MELTITKTSKQASMSREVIHARIHFTGATPSRQAIAQALAKEVGAKRERLVVAQIKTSFGDSQASVLARNYSDEAVMKRLERANLLAKNQPAAKPEPAPTPEPVPEAADDSAQEAAAEPAPEVADKPAEDKKSE